MTGTRKIQTPENAVRTIGHAKTPGARYLKNRSAATDRRRFVKPCREVPSLTPNPRLAVLRKKRGSGYLKSIPNEMTGNNGRRSLGEANNRDVDQSTAIGGFRHHPARGGQGDPRPCVLCGASSGLIQQRSGDRSLQLRKRMLLGVRKTQWQAIGHCNLRFSPVWLYM